MCRLYVMWSHVDATAGMVGDGNVKVAGVAVAVYVVNVACGATGGAPCTPKQSVNVCNDHQVLKAPS